MKNKRLFLTLSLIMLCGSFVFAGGAQALTLTPVDADYWGNENDANTIKTIILDDLGFTPEVYKQEVGGSESGELASYYTTVFSNTTSDPSNAVITYDSAPPFVAELLLVKDGDQTPAWYAFLLDGWNGTETISLVGFWPNQGAISHVAMYGSAPVPEPATMLLLGTGLVGLAGASRKKLFKK